MVMRWWVASMVAGMLAAGPASAGGALNGKLGAYAGKYKYEDSGFSDDSSMFGVLLGGVLAGDRVFGDVTIEYAQLNNDSFDRTDMLFTTGLYLGKIWTASVGYRRGMFGDGAFNDDIYLESGPFFGVSVNFHSGQAVTLNAAMAYNKLDLEVQGQSFDDLDLGGISLKLQAGFVGTPHAIFVRTQRFKGDVEGTAIAYEEDYIVFGYQFSPTLRSW